MTSIPCTPRGIRGGTRGRRRCRSDRCTLVQPDRRALTLVLGLVRRPPLERLVLLPGQAPRPSTSATGTSRRASPAALAEPTAGDVNAAAADAEAPTATPACKVGGAGWSRDGAERRRVGEHLHGATSPQAGDGTRCVSLPRVPREPATTTRPRLLRVRTRLEEEEAAADLRPFIATWTRAAIGQCSAPRWVIKAGQKEHDAQGLHTCRSVRRRASGS